MGSDPDRPPSNGTARLPLTREEKEQELQGLLQFGVVRPHTQLHNLLAYLGKKSLEDPTRPLKEYTIGVEALGKPGDYDPRIDPTVRVEVAKLRIRLKEYYDTAGAARRVRLTIPKGGYMAEFAERIPDAAYGGPGTRAWTRAIWPVLTAILLAAVVLLALRGYRSRPPLPSELEAFWAAHFADSTPTLIVYGTPLFVKVQGSFYRDTHVNRREEIDQSNEIRSIIQALRPREVRPMYNFTGLGEAEAVFLVTRILASQGASLVIKRSSNVSWEDLRDKHVVILGGRKFNPQIPDLPYKPKFEAVNRKVVNLRPQGSEPAEYQTSRKTPHGDITEEFALISVHPGFSPNTRLVTLESSSTEGTLAAAEFLTRPDTIRELLTRNLPLPRSGPIRAFQVVVGARFNNAVVVKLSYITHALLP